MVFVLKEGRGYRKQVRLDTVESWKEVGRGHHWRNSHNCSRRFMIERVVEKSWDLVPSGSTGVPEESSGEAVDEREAQLQRFQNFGEASAMRQSWKTAVAIRWLLNLEDAACVVSGRNREGDLSSPLVPRGSWVMLRCLMEFGFALTWLWLYPGSSFLE